MPIQYPPSQAFQTPIDPGVMQKLARRRFEQEAQQAASQQSALQQALTQAQIGETQANTKYLGARATATGQPKALSPSQAINKAIFDVIKTLPQEEQNKYLLEHFNRPSSVTNVNLGKPASAAERTSIARGRASVDALDNLKSLFVSLKIYP